MEQSDACLTPCVALLLLHAKEANIYIDVHTKTEICIYIKKREIKHNVIVYNRYDTLIYKKEICNSGRKNKRNNIYNKFNGIIKFSIKKSNKRKRTIRNII